MAVRCSLLSLNGGQAKMPAHRPQFTILLYYDVAIMMARTQITLDPEIQRRARQRANDLGVSLAEYVRRLVARDLGGAPPSADPARIFDLGSSARSDIANNKDAMIAEAFTAAHLRDLGR